MPLTPKNRKEEWLEGLVEHETTLTPKNRCEAWMKEIIDASGGGGTGGGVLNLHMDRHTKALDKTYAEIEPAFGDTIIFMDSTALLIGTEENEDGYFVYFADFYDAPTVAKITFKANTKNDYPVAQMG